MRTLVRTLCCVVSLLALASPAAANLAITATQSGQTVLPGGAPVGVMTVSVHNTDVLLTATLRSISFANTTSGPGTLAQKDLEWQGVNLSTDATEQAARAQAGTYQQVVPVDPPDGGGGGGWVATFVGGIARFDLNLSVSPGTTLTLYLSSGASLGGRDGDALDLSIPSAAAVSASVPVSGTFPIAPSGNFPIDGMAAAQIGLFPVNTPTLPVGSSRALALDLRLPANGYQSDVLQRLAVGNAGTARAGQEITAMEAWLDDGDGVFKASSDARLGTLAWTGDRWQLTGLSVSVPSSGVRVFFTVDIDELAEAGRTVRLALPTLPDVGVGMASADDGPIDRIVANPSALTIAVVDRIALALKPIDPGTVPPGQSNVPLLALVATNTYAVDKTLVALAAGDATTGSGTQPDLDAELGSLALRDDADGDGILDPSDPSLAKAFFVSGRASFGGFAWTIPAGKTRQLFVSGDVSLLRAADGDVLAAMIGSAADLEFADPTALSAVFPLGPGAAWKVDGMVAGEVQVKDAPGVTLGPADGPALGLDLLVRHNGYVDDTLDRLSVVNLGTAPDAQLSEVHLWSDGGDGIPSADDQDLGVMAPSGGAWVSGPLATALPAAGTRLFVTVRTGASVTDSATVRFAVPKNGIDVVSGNDGPIDQAVVNPDALLLSTRGLLASLDVQPNAVTLGQGVTLRMTVRNVSSETINGVAPAAPRIAGSAGLSLTSGPSPATANVVSGGQQTFTWTFTANAAGTATFADSAMGTGASSGATVASLAASSDLLHVFQQAATLPWSASTAMPLTVNRGQINVVPMFLTFGNGTPSADVSITGLKLRVESSSGAGIVPADLLARVAVQVGSTTHVERTSLETSGSDVTLPLATPITVSGGAPVTAAIALDIAPGTVVPNFRLAIPDSTFFTAEDAATGAPVTLALQGQSYPVPTGLARVVAPATELDVTAVGAGAHTAGQGQKDVALATLRLLNPGVTGVTSDVRVASFALLLRDTTGTALAQPSQVIERVKVHVGPQILADRPVTMPDDSLIDVSLSPLLSVPVNAPLDVSVTADLPTGARLGTFRMTLADSTRLDARDPNSGSRVAVVYGTNPVAGDSVTIQAPAESVAVVGVPRLPSAVGVGSAGVMAFQAFLRNPGASGAAAVRIDSLVVRCVDEGRNPLTPALYVKRMHVLWNGAPLATLSDPPGPGNVMALGLPGPTIAPGTRDTLGVTLDFDAGAPPGTFELVLNASGVLASDANTRAAVAVAPDSNFDFPILSGLTHLAAPSRTLVAGLDDHMPAALAADGSEIVAGSITLLNDATAGSGSITVDHLDVHAADAARAGLGLGSCVASVSLYRNGAAWASVSLAPGDTLATLAGAALTLMPQAPEALELRFVARAGSRVPGLRLGFAAADVGVVQSNNPLLLVAVTAPAGHTFPLWSEYGGFVITQLEPSYSNFPNPFAAGREATHFAYYLPSAGRVTLRIWTPRGERVASLLDGVTRAAGLHQDDAWDGRNGSGRTVANGVYLAELVVDLDGGGSHRLLRKVAVVR